MQLRNVTRAILEVRWTLCFLLPGHEHLGWALGTITGALRECDFTYDEAQIRCLLGWHAYNKHTGTPGVIRTSVNDGETVIRQHVFIAMETPPSSCSLPSSAMGSSCLDDRQPCTRGVMTCQRLATALTALIMLTSMLLFARLVRQSETWEYARLRHGCQDCPADVWAGEGHHPGTGTEGPRGQSTTTGGRSRQWGRQPYSWT